MKNILIRLLILFSFLFKLVSFSIFSNSSLSSSKVGERFSKFIKGTDSILSIAIIDGVFTRNKTKT